MKIKSIALDDLFIRDFPEFRNISGKLKSDHMIYDMLSEYYRCKIVSNKFLETDKRREEYNTIIDELQNEIRERILEAHYNEL